MKVTLAFVVVTLMVASLVAYASLTSGVGGNQSTPTIVVEVVHDSDGSPIAGMYVAAGPVASLKDLLFTTIFVTLKGCNIGGITYEAVPFDNRTLAYPPSCPMRSYTTDFLGRVYILNATGSHYLIEVKGPDPGDFTYTLFAMNESKSVNVILQWPSGEFSITSQP